MVVKLFKEGLLEYFLDCLLFSLLRSQLLLLLGFVLPLFQPFLDAFANLYCDFLVAVVDDFNEQVLALLNSRIMVQHNFQHITNNGFMVHCQVYLQTVKLLKLGLALKHNRQYLPLPHRGDQQINNKQLVLIMHDHLLQYKLIILHDGVHVQLHVKFL